MKRIIEIPISNDMVPEKDECFEIELTEPTGGAILGPIVKMAVTITNDEGMVLQSADMKCSPSELISLFKLRIQLCFESLGGVDECKREFDASAPRHVDRSDQGCNEC